ncbi:MAG: hypothetical protein IPK82_34840 [Polyangiaceae bacterium]|nr:hypothetical protein [Polyangiaceae bacterium]
MSQGNWSGGYGPPGGGGYGPPGGGGYGPPPSGGGAYGPPPGGRPPEIPFFTDHMVNITNARAVLAGTTYALANITSVRSWTVSKPLLPLLLGILCLVAGAAVAFSSGGCGGAILLVGVVLAIFYFLSKDKHYIRIGTAGGEVDALQSADPAYINKIVTALNNAIIHRG